MYAALSKTQRRLAHRFPIQTILSISQFQIDVEGKHSNNFIQLIPLLTSLHSFQFCENGVAQTYDCPTGLHFNFEKRQCDIPQNAGCDSNVGPGPGQFSCPPGNEIFHPHPTECSRYFICSQGQAHPMTCPPNLIFDINNRRCQIEGQCVGSGLRKH